MTIYGGSVFPASLDSFTPRLIDNVDEVEVDHISDTALVAIENIEAKLGITGGVATGFGGISISPSISDPSTSGVPTLWVDGSASPDSLMYTDNTDVVHNLLLGPSGLLELRVVPKTVDYTLVASDKNTFFTNEGASGGVTLTLPDASTIALEYYFYVQNANMINIRLSTGDSFRHDGATHSGTNAVMRSDVIGNVVRIVSVDANEWMITDIIGVWEFA
jgi:hypothetical protein